MSSCSTSNSDACKKANPINARNGGKGDYYQEEHSGTSFMDVRGKLDNQRSLVTELVDQAQIELTQSQKACASTKRIVAREAFAGIANKNSFSSAQETVTGVIESSISFEASKAVLASSEKTVNALTAARDTLDFHIHQGNVFADNFNWSEYSSAINAKSDVVNDVIEDSIEQVDVVASIEVNLKQSLLAELKQSSSSLENSCGCGGFNQEALVIWFNKEFTRLQAEFSKQYAERKSRYMKIKADYNQVIKLKFSASGQRTTHDHKREEHHSSMGASSSVASAAVRGADTVLQDMYSSATSTKKN